MYSIVLYKTNYDAPILSQSSYNDFHQENKAVVNMNENSAKGTSVTPEKVIPKVNFIVLQSYKKYKHTQLVVE